MLEVDRRELTGRDDVDGSGDLGVGRRDQLDPVGQVELVAVVGRRVVAGGDHDAGVGPEFEDAVGEHRRGQRSGQELGPAAQGGDHSDGVDGEGGRAVAGVVPDDHHRLFHPFGLEPAHQSGRRLADHQAVHPIRSRAQRRTQTGGAERDPSGEEGDDLRRFFGGGFGVGHLQQRAEFVGGGGVGIVDQPTTCFLERFGKFFGRSGHRRSVAQVRVEPLVCDRSSSIGWVPSDHGNPA